LRSANHRYPVIEMGDETSQIHWIDVISDSYFALDDTDQLIELFASPAVHMVTLTITEKAYVLIKEDLKNVDHPKSAMGILFLGLKKRKELLGAPLSILSCDNVRENGNTLKQLMLDYAELVEDKKMKTWIEKEISFPNSMVDRIVPALTDEKIGELQKKFNINTSALLATESFSQWIIEDHFKTPRPPLEKVGVQFVKDIRPFEEMKLRLLNASHSLIAYSGRAKKYLYVHEAIQDPVVQSEVFGLYEEVIPWLDVPHDIDLKKYTALLIKRFNNPLLPHPLHQIAMDGSHKIPQRILPSIAAACQKKSSHSYLSLVIDYWLQYCYEDVFDDPLKDEIQALKNGSLHFVQFKEKVLKQLFGLPFNFF
jgi:fructuronate reductase